jgi:hypothetical protein
MAKVKKVESKLQAGKAPTIKEPAKVVNLPKPEKPKTSNANTVTALRNGIERGFPRQIWDHLPQGKEGWKEVVETPKLPAQKPATDSPAQSYTDAVKEYTELFGEAPGQDLSIEDLNSAIAAKKGEQTNG